MTIETKEYGKLSLKQLKDFYAHYHNLQNEKQDVYDINEEDPEIFTSLFSLIPPWSIWYETPWQQCLALYFFILGLDKEIIKANDSHDPAQANLGFLDNADNYTIDFDSLSDEEKGTFLSLLFSITEQLNALTIYQVSMSDLVLKVKNGDDDSLFCAVLVDRSALSSPSIAKRIQRAHFDNDNAFFDKLSKSITRTKPRRPSKELDDVRFIFEVLDESIGLDNLSEKEIYKTIVDDLELYPTENTKDIFSGLKKLLQRRKKAKET